MREIIRDPGDSNRRPSVVESDGLVGRVILEIDGQLHRLGPDEARRIARALLQAASIVDRRPVEGPTEDDD